MWLRTAISTVVVACGCFSSIGCAKGRPESMPALSRMQPPPVCASDQLAGVSPDKDELSEHREFEVPVIDYPSGEDPKVWGLPLSLQIDESGRVTCYLVDDMFGRSRTINTRRRALLEAVSGWHYRPFVRDGEPVRAVVREHIYEQSLRENFEALPDAPLDQVTISLARSGCFGTCPSYTVEIHGDGAVEYVGRGHVDVTGRHAYRIPQQDVAALVENARRKGIWGMSGSYRAPITDNPTYELSLQFGREFRVIEDYVGAMVGMSKAVSEFEDEVDRVGRTAEWTQLSMRAVDQLQSEEFDFRSKEAADLLVRAIANKEGNDERAMLKLIELGAPLVGGDLSGQMGMTTSDTAAINQALLHHRESLVEPLLSHGVLDTNGKPDQQKVDAAFRAAIRGGRLALVEKLWSQTAFKQNPSLFFEDVEGDGEASIRKQSPVTLLLSRPYGDRGWQGLEITRWLVGKGCDLKARAANGDTLLHIAVDADDIDFVRYLLAQGLEVSAPGAYDLPALGSAQDEEIALLLLQSGSDWQMDDRGQGFLRYAKDQHWGRVLAWIAEHGAISVDSEDG